MTTVKILKIKSPEKIAVIILTFRVLCPKDADGIANSKSYLHSVLTICMQTGTCDTQSGDLVFFSAAFDEFSVFKKT